MDDNTRVKFDHVNIRILYYSTGNVLFIVHNLGKI